MFFDTLLFAGMIVPFQRVPSKYMAPSRYLWGRLEFAMYCAVAHELLKICFFSVYPRSRSNGQTEKNKS